MNAENIQGLAVAGILLFVILVFYLGVGISMLMANKNGRYDE